MYTTLNSPGDHCRWPASRTKVWMYTKYQIWEGRTIISLKSISDWACGEWKKPDYYSFWKPNRCLKDAICQEVKLHYRCSVTVLATKLVVPRFPAPATMRHAYSQSENRLEFLQRRKQFNLLRRPLRFFPIGKDVEKGIQSFSRNHQRNVFHGDLNEEFPSHLKRQGDFISPK